MNKKFNIKNLIFLLLAVILVFSVIRQQSAMNRINKEIQNSKAQLEEKNQNNERLKEEAAKAQSDEYLEKLARKELNMIKVGEKTAVNKGSN